MTKHRPSQNVKLINKNYKISQFHAWLKTKILKKYSLLQKFSKILVCANSGKYPSLYFNSARLKRQTHAHLISPSQITAGCVQCDHYTQRHFCQPSYLYRRNTCIIELKELELCRSSSTFLCSRKVFAHALWTEIVNIIILGNNWISGCRKWYLIFSTKHLYKQTCAVPNGQMSDTNVSFIPITLKYFFFQTIQINNTRQHFHGFSYLFGFNCAITCVPNN